MERRYLVPLMLVLVAVAGCTSTKITQVETGMFDNSPERLLAAYELVENRIGNNEILTRQEFEAMGFDLKAPNVEDLPGQLALKRLFGDAAFKGRNGSKKAAASLNQFADYRGYVIPHKRIMTVSDRIYISEKEIFRTGESIRILILFRGDNLCYHQLECVKIDTYYSRYAFADAILSGLKGPGKAAAGILETLYEYERPGIKPFIPIPVP